MKKLILVLVIFFLLPVLASAQSTSQLTPEQAQDEFRSKFESFLKANSFRCNFENGYFASWEKGKLKSKATKDPLVLIFDSIDYKNKTARLIGNAGASDVFFITNLGGITLIEITGSGSFISTTINSPKAQDKNLIHQYFAVHSRHIATLLLGEPMSSQYYGQCEIWDINR